MIDTIIEGHKVRKGFVLAYKARRDFSIVAVLAVLMHGPLYLFITYSVLTRTAKSHFKQRFYRILAATNKFRSLSQR